MPTPRALPIAFLLIAPLVAGTACGQAREPDLAQASRLIVAGTNAFRRERGVEELRPDASLTEAARHFAAFMAKTDRFDHDADGRLPADRARLHGYDYCLVAENIGFEFHSLGFATADLARTLVEGWKHSPGHRKNMEEPNVVDTGVAVARSARTGRYYGVQMFGRSAKLTSRFSVENRSRRTVEYRIESRSFSLSPRMARTHQECTAEALEFQGKAVHAGNGDRFVVVQEKGSVAIKRE